MTETETDIADYAPQWDGCPYCDNPDGNHLEFYPCRPTPQPTEGN
jgi:hypothetical protein